MRSVGSHDEFVLQFVVGSEVPRENLAARKTPAVDTTIETLASLTGRADLLH